MRTSLLCLSWTWCHRRCCDRQSEHSRTLLLCFNEHLAELPTLKKYYASTQDTPEVSVDFTEQETKEPTLT